MALQAALLGAHPFAPFGFGGAADGLGGAFAALERGCCCFEDEEPGASPAAGALLPSGSEGGGGDAREATRDLLSFIDSASSNIKLALDKPGKSKRKVNHRKYLQKQIKRCGALAAARAAPGPADAPARRPPAAPPPGKPPARREAAQAAASLQSRSLAALFGSLRAGPGPAGPAGGAAGAGDRKVPLRARNLPPSFFTEPSRGGPAGPGAAHAETGAAAADLLALLAPDYGADAEAGALLDALPAGAAGAGAGAPLALAPGLFEPPPPPGLLYPEPWSAAPAKPALPAPADAAGGAEDAPARAAFAPFFPDCTPPASYGCGAGFGLWRPDAAWAAAPGERGPPRD
ncbi:protein FAM181B [Ctenodactylus gundi]